MIYKKIEQYIKTHIDPKLKKPIFSGKPKILVALSGGPDSTFLLYFLKKLENRDLITLAAVHLNHEWRKESKEDEIFCKQICDNLKVPIFVQSAKDLDLTIKFNGSKEEFGRKLRRYFFEQTKRKLGADYVALAHHEQDQQETFFIRLVRGCSLSGLTAIKPVQGFYIRPLLSVSKQEVLDFLENKNIEYKTDKTNESDEFLRNRIRNQVLPVLKKIDPRFDKKFKSSLEELSKENLFLQKLTKKSLDIVFNFSQNNTFVGDKEKFVELDEVLKKRLIIEWLKIANIPFVPSTGLLNEIIRFISSNRGGTHKIHENWEIKKQKQNFWIEKR